MRTPAVPDQVCAAAIDLAREPAISEGGADRVGYRIDVQGHEGPYAVQVEWLYQPVSYRFAQDLCQEPAAAQETVCRYYAAVDHTPAVVASAQKKVR